MTYWYHLKVDKYNTIKSEVALTYWGRQTLKVRTSSIMSSFSSFLKGERAKEHIYTDLLGTANGLII